VIVGSSIARGFKGAEMDEMLRWATRDWRVVGIFDAGTSGFSSEIWGDVNQFMQAFRRPGYSSVIFRLRDPSEFQNVKSRVESDPRLTLEAKRETKYYAEQSQMMSKFLRILGTSLTIIFSLGAIIGAMITMYSAVANRIAEIGTLRALGFRRRDILLAFLLESLLLGFLGGFSGLLFASLMQFITISTVNFQTFSELAFRFALSFEIVYKGMIFSLIMGFVGGLLPALRASRMVIVEALRAS
jgi:ABC-type antimicrobial peptide transport system permease subunit